MAENDNFKKIHADNKEIYSNISYLSEVVSNIATSLDNGLQVIDEKVNIVSATVADVSMELESLSEEHDKLSQHILAFIKEYRMDTDLQLAETRIGNLRQELQIQFGFYAEIRRMATGILQAVDVGIVGEDTIQFETESLMIKAPRYWLAPTLVAVASLLRHDTDTYQKALSESLRRDKYKATLFFMLTTQRAGLDADSYIWLERYLRELDPHSLSQETIVVLEAIISGQFSEDAIKLMIKTTSHWVDTLSTGGEFIAMQEQKWLSFYFATDNDVNYNKYQNLEKYAKPHSWASISDSLEHANKHVNIIMFFAKMILELDSVDPAANVNKVKLDQILDNLVTSFDEEELPLRKQVRLNELIIEYRGDREKAEARMTTEETAFDHNVDFLELLTNSILNAQTHKVSPSVQKLALIISQSWILSAYHKFVEEFDSINPNTIELTLDGLSVGSTDGRNVDNIKSLQERYYQNLEDAELAKLKSPIAAVIVIILLGCAVGAVLQEVVLGSAVGILSGVALIAYDQFFSSKRKRIKQAIADRLEKYSHKSAVLCSEIVVFRQECAEENAKTPKVMQLFNSIRS